MDKFQIDGHKLYWHLDRVQEWQEKKYISPIYIEVSPVSYCNQRCIFCGVDFAMKDKHMLNTDIFIEKIKELGEAGLKSIMFAGEGEPFLHKELDKFIETAKNSGIDTSITTNGSVGDEEVFNKIIPDLSWIKFSVDAGTKDIYEIIHQSPKHVFDKVTENIKTIVDIRNKNKLKTAIGVQFLIIEENLKDIENAVNLFSDIGVDYIVFKPFSKHPQMEKIKDINYTKDTLDYIENICGKNKERINIIFRRNSFEKYIEKSKKFERCYALPFWGYIDSKGDFYTCSIFLGDDRFKSGNIYDYNIKDILFSDKRKSSIDYGLNGLEIAKECRVNCRMARVNEFLEMLSHKPEHINFI